MEWIWRLKKIIGKAEDKNLIISIKKTWVLKNTMNSPLKKSDFLSKNLNKEWLILIKNTNLMDKNIPKTDPLNNLREIMEDRTYTANKWPFMTHIKEDSLTKRDLPISINSMIITIITLNLIIITNNLLKKMLSLKCSKNTSKRNSWKVCLIPLSKIWILIINFLHLNKMTIFLLKTPNKIRS